MQWGKGLPAQHLDMDLSCHIAVSYTHLLTRVTIEYMPSFLTLLFLIVETAYNRMTVSYRHLCPLEDVWVVENEDLFSNLNIQMLNSSY